MIETKERNHRDRGEIFREDLAAMEPDTTRRFPAINLDFLDPEMLALLSENPGAPVAENADGKPIQKVAKVKIGDTEIIPIVDIHRNSLGEYSVVHHGIEIQTLPGIVVVPMRITPSGTPEFFVINQTRRFLEPSLHSSREGANSSFSQGKIESKETINDAIHRELLQETGLTAIKTIHLGTKYIHQSYGQGIADFELAVVVYEEDSKSENLLEPDEEISAYGWMSEEKISELDLISMDQRMTSAARFIRWFLHESDGQYEELVNELAQEQQEQ